MKKSIILIFISMTLTSFANDFESIRKELIGKYKVLKLGKTEAGGMVFTKDTFTKASLEEIQNNAQISPQRTNKYLLSVMEDGSYYLIPHRGLKSKKYDDGFRVVKTKTGWRLYITAGEAGEPGVFFVDLVPLS